MFRTCICALFPYVPWREISLIKNPRKSAPSIRVNQREINREINREIKSLQVGYTEKYLKNKGRNTTIVYF